MALLRKLAGHKVHYVDHNIPSIIDNLNNILKCTRDYGSFLQSFGISDYRYLSTREDIVESIIDEVKENIELFESRILVNEIKHVEDDSVVRLFFIIDASLRSNNQPLKLFLNPVDDGLQVKL
jgi:predicted component of type VI protein secretion system